MYESFYKFRAKPFQLNPDARFFFSSGTHKRALAYLRYGVQQEEGFIVVTGDVGTGKTTLVSRLFQSLDSDSIVAAKITNTQLKADDLLRMVAAEFELPYQRTSKAALLKNLETHFRGCVQEGKRVLLVIDEAQNLPRAAIEELRMLSNFQWRGRPLVQSFLLGQKEFRRIMRSEGFEQLRQRVIAAYHLHPLTEEETREYIEHRLKLVGWHGDPRFTPEAYREIYSFSQGIPRKTNLLCDRILLFACIEDLHVIDHGVLQAVLDDVRQEMWELGDPDEEPLPPPDALSEEPLSSTAAPSELSGPAVLKDTPATRDAKERTQESRLQDVERSMHALTAALRGELGQLRQAISLASKEKSDNDSKN